MLLFDPQVANVLIEARLEALRGGPPRRYGRRVARPN